MARQLAKKLNYIFIDSGAMYRAITLYFIRNNINVLSIDQVSKALENIELSFRFNSTTGNNDIYLNGENAEPFIRTLQIAEKVSEVAAIREVRTFAVQQQQKIGKDKGIVMDGRDIGTAVFPEAELKIFMTADVEVRVARRYKELIAKNPDILIDDVRNNLAQRDYIDSNREVSPLRKADDAIVLDNSNLSPEDQLGLAYKWAKEIIDA